MIRRIALVCLLVSGMLVPAVSVAAPSNDDFPGRSITNLPFAEGFDLNTSTAEPGEPSASCNYFGPYRTIWYSFTPASSAPLVALAQGSGVNEFGLAAYTGTNLPDLTEIGCAMGNRYYNLDAEISLVPTPGTTYHFQVSYYSGYQGAFELFESEAPANDAFANAKALTGFPLRSEPMRDFGSTIEAGEPKPACATNPSRSTWFKWTSPESARVVIDRLDGLRYSALAIYRGTDMASLTYLDCSSNAKPVAVDVVAGETYHFQALDIAGLGGEVVINVQRQVHGDDKSQALTAMIGINPVRVFRATTEPGESLACAWGETVWFKISNLSGVLKLSLPAGAPYTLMAIYDQSMVRINCFGSNQSGYLEADPSKDYYVQLSAPALYSSDHPDTSFKIEQVPPPPNDAFASAQEIGGTAAVAVGNNAGATMQVQEPLPSCAPRSGATIWYRWTPVAGRPYVIDTVGSAIDTTLAVYTGDSLASLSEVACNDDHNARQSRVVLGAEQGTTYYLQVGGFASSRGDISLNIDIEPLNDDLSEAEVASGPVYQDTATNLRATFEPMEPKPSCNRTYDTVNTLWYRYAATTPGAVTVDTYGSSFDTVLAVYSGTTYLNFTEVACSEDVGVSTNQWSLLTFTAEAGKTYYIQVGSWKNPNSSTVINGTVVMRVVQGGI